MNLFLLSVLTASAACVDDVPSEAQDFDVGTATPWLGGTPCSAAKLDEIRAPNTTRDYVVVDCDAQLTSADVITKRVQFRGEASSQVTFDCGGATLRHAGDAVQIFSERRVAADQSVTWEPVHDVTIANCAVEGGIRIWGQGINGQAPDVTTSSHTEGHTERARAAAPHHITIRDTAIIGSGRVPLYLGPGVHDSTFEGLDISEGAGSLAIYFDAETTSNTLRGSYLHVASDREQLALDGSSGNRIIENRFGSITTGGIFLYRNCGEGGAVRHATPSDNLIMNNTFDATGLAPVKPAIWVASRRGTSYYCPDDNAYPLGSGLDDDDHATGNVIMQNQYVTSAPVAPPVATAFRSDELGPNTPNDLAANRVVTTAVDEPTGCVVGTSPRTFLGEGETRVFDAASDACFVATCHDQTVTRSACVTRSVYFRCVALTNDGCRGTTQCPAGTAPVAVQAACNLEFPALRYANVVGLPANTVAVTRPSDVVTDGHCQVGDVDVQQGSASIATPLPPTLTFGCREFDQNGGECKLLGKLQCRGVAPPPGTPIEVTPVDAIGVRPSSRR